MNHHGKLRSILSLGREFDPSHVLALSGAKEHLAGPVTILRGERVEAVQSGFNVFPRVAEHLQRFAVDKGQTALEIGFVNYLREKFRQVPEPLLAQSQRFFGALAIRNVAKGAHNSQQVAASVKLRLPLAREPTYFAVGPADAGIPRQEWRFQRRPSWPSQ